MAGTNCTTKKFKIDTEHEWGYTVFFATKGKMEALVVGPKKRARRYALLITKDPDKVTEADLRNKLEQYLRAPLRCKVCGTRYADYFKVSLKKDGSLDLDDVVCGECDPTAQYSVAAFEMMDTLFGV